MPLLSIIKVAEIIIVRLILDDCLSQSSIQLVECASGGHMALLESDAPTVRNFERSLTLMSYYQASNDYCYESMWFCSNYCLVRTLNLILLTSLSKEGQVHW